MLEHLARAELARILARAWGGWLSLWRICGGRNRFRGAQFSLGAGFMLIV
jgi:hypothetical protein